MKAIDEETVSLHFCLVLGSKWSNKVHQVSEVWPAQKHLLKKKEFNYNKLKLRKVILLDSGATMDLFCNVSMVWNIHKTKGTLRIQTNGDTMVVPKKATVEGYWKKCGMTKMTSQKLFPSKI